MSIFWTPDARRPCGTCHDHGNVLVARSQAEVDAGAMPFYYVDCPAALCQFRYEAPEPLEVPVTEDPGVSATEPPGVSATEGAGG